MSLFNNAKADSGQSFVTLCSDNDREFTGTSLQRALEESSFHHVVSSPYSIKPNSRVERKNLSIFETARTLLVELQMTNTV